MINFDELLRKKEAEGRASGYDARTARGTASSSETFYNSLIKKKELEGALAQQQDKPTPMPHANLSVPQMDRVKQFFADREYDGVPFKLDGSPNMDAVMDVIRKEQENEYMHRDEKTQTFHIVKENNNQHPYDAYFQRKPKNE